MSADSGPFRQAIRQAGGPRAKRYEGDGDLALAGQALDLATKQVEGDHEQQQTSGGP